MKLNHFIILVSLVILGAACSPSVPATPTIPGVPVIPATLIPKTSIPVTIVPATKPAEPGATVTPRNLTNGPYLAYLRDRESSHELVLMDADGKGEAVFPFLLNGHVIMPPSLSNLVSPDGAWLAFYSGSAGPAFGQVGPNASDLTLNLMSLGVTSPAISTKVVARLLSADYPANFAQAAQELGRTDITAENLRDAFVSGITQSISWSPDGSTLAFAGQMDGLSSDLYLYHTADGTIQRLSSGPQQVQWIDWSPDGNWILDGSTYWVGEGMSYDIFATSLDGKVIHQLLTDYRLGNGLTWINTHAFLAYQSENGPGNYGLERVDVESGSMDTIWEGSFSSKTVDATGKWLALQSGTDGLYLIDLTTLVSSKVQVPDASHDYGLFQDILPMGGEPQRAFLTRDDTRNNSDQVLYFLSTSGQLNSAGTSADLFSVAPNQTDWIAIRDTIQLFAGGSSQPRTFDLPPGTKRGDFQRIVWRPDSSGIFLVSGNNQLYALDLSSGDSALVEPSLSSTWDTGLFWVR
jgi:Tol biopolymer transport system component